jgi:hypothetical protein
MDNYQKDKKAFELFQWLKENENNEEVTEEIHNNKAREYLDAIRELDRLNLRECYDPQLAVFLNAALLVDNINALKLTETLDLDKFDVFTFIRDEGININELDIAERYFSLIPPIIKQGVKIPSHIRALYAESRRCYIYKQNSAAIVLSRSIIETALKDKLGLNNNNREATAGLILEIAEEQGLISRKIFWKAKKVISAANKILHQAKNAEDNKAKYALDYTKDFLEELFGVIE